MGLDDRIHEISPFFGGEVGELGDFAVGDGQEMSGIVRVFIEKEVRVRGTVEDESFTVVTSVGKFGEEVTHIFRVFASLDVLDAPVRMEVVHSVKRLGRQLREGVKTLFGQKASMQPGGSLSSLVSVILPVTVFAFFQTFGERC